MAFKIKRNDTSPSISGTAKSGTGSIIPLTNASARFLLYPMGGDVPKIDEAAVIFDEDAGAMRYDWQEGDTDTEGAFVAFFKVTFENGAVETFQNDEPLRVDVT